MFCPRCGTGTQPNQVFCANCGAALGAGSVRSAVGPASAPASPAVPQQPAASLHPIPDGGLALEVVLAWLESGGYSAKIVTAERGKRHIETRSQGSLFNIFTPGCQSGRCASLELVFAFSTNGKFDTSQLNKWNSEIPWCKAYYDDVNDPCLDMDIALWPGGTYESLNNRFAAWNNILGRFIAHYYLR